MAESRLLTSCEVKRREIQPKLMWRHCSAIAGGRPASKGLPSKMHSAELFDRLDPEGELGDGLLGEYDLLDGKAGEIGRLWVYCAHAVTGDLDTELPYWDKSRLSFVLTGNRNDEDLGSVKEKFLYLTEMLPANISFDCECVLLGSREELEFSGLVEAFGVMASAEGFTLGATTGYGDGRFALDNESVKIRETRYDFDKFDVVEGEFEKLDIEPLDAGAPVAISLILECPGPFLILDPQRRETDERKGNNLPDMMELRIDASTPVLTGKAVTQILRQISAWLAAQNSISGNGFDYSKSLLDNKDQQLRDSNPTSLTSTQRLFGIAGWGKTLSVHKITLQKQHHLHCSRAGT